MTTKVRWRKVKWINISMHSWRKNGSSQINIASTDKKKNHFSSKCAKNLICSWKTTMNGTSTRIKWMIRSSNATYAISVIQNCPSATRSRVCSFPQAISLMKRKSNMISHNTKRILKRSTKCRRSLKLMATSSISTSYRSRVAITTRSTAWSSRSSWKFPTAARIK